MYEQTTLQEAYTGALIAGKGKILNNINVIMDRTRFKTEEWVRVRFGAGVPWRRCWCVISPPDEKEYQKQQKELKKRSPYDRSHAPVLKGTIQFYDSKKEGKKQKKARPIASITDAYSAYAIYPQAKSLIDGSTLLKLEGNITIHSDPPSSTEGFVFVMPETHPMVTGFEMMLRFLFPTWDTFGLYGRPGRLVASVLDSRSLMFAMPKHKRYGYLEILDVSNLILEDGSAQWTEREWRKRMKDLTGQRMNSMNETEPTHRRSGSRKSNRLSFGSGSNTGASTPQVGFTDDSAPLWTSRSFSANQKPLARNDSAPPVDRSTGGPAARHVRNNSDPHAGGGVTLRDGPGGYGEQHHDNYSSSHAPPPMRGVLQDRAGRGTPEPMNSDDERVARSTPVRELESMRRLETPEPVSRPPAFNHGPQSRPGAKAYHSPELRRANSRLSSSTLSQLAKAGGVAIPADAYGDDSSQRRGRDAGPRYPVHPNANPMGISANDNRSREALISPVSSQSTSSVPPSTLSAGSQRSKSPFATHPHGPPPAGTPPVRDAQGNLQPPGSAPLEPRGPPPGHAAGMGPQRPYPGNYRPDHARKTPPAGHGGQSAGPNAQGTNYRQNIRSPPQGSSSLQNEYLPPLNTSPTQISRKPVPHQMDVVQNVQDATPLSASSADSFKTTMLNQAGMAQIRPQEYNHSPMPEQAAFHRQDSTRSGASSHYPESKPSNAPMAGGGGLGIHRQDSTHSGASSFYHDDGRAPPLPRHEIHRHDSEKSSHYGDADSTTSPDYSSTRKSTDTSTSVERPRAGVLKTVGGGELPPPVPSLHNKASDYNIPSVDFGPTVNFDSQRANASTPSGPPPPPHGQDAQKRPFLPAGLPGGADPGHSRQESNDAIRRVAWQPGRATPGASGQQGQSVSAEQYVQQRAAATPLYSHARSPSGNTLGRSTTPTPSMSRTISEDAVYQMNQRHSRSSSAELLQRPSSQGAMAALNTGSTGEMSSNLSAREQEHIARVTGTPLINMARNSNVPQGAGLVGAIEAREREKQQIKQGVNNQVVQHAINQRQAQAAYYQQQQQQQQQQMYQSGAMPTQPQGMYHPNMGRGHAQYGPPNQQQAGPYGPPMGSGYPHGPPGPQGGRGYGPPRPRLPPGPQSPGPDPRMMPPRGPYSPGGGPHPQSSQGGRGAPSPGGPGGAGGYPGHGQAF